MFGYEQSESSGRCGPARHGGHRRHRHGRGDFSGFPFGGGGPFGPGWGSRGGWRKARRGDIRTAALLLLEEEPRNGYEIMQILQERSEGLWRPSPGSVYPALAQLEDEGLIRSQEIDGRKVFAITDEGRALLAERGSDRPAPWEEMSRGVGDEHMQFGKLMREVAFAFAQLARTGSESQLAAAREVLVQTRRDLYSILADGEDAQASAGGTVDSDA
jgi:DNA-binding PadR family transcriptional regulator